MTKGEEVYDKNKNKYDGKYRIVVPDVPEGEAYDQYSNKLKGNIKKVNPKVVNLGEKLFDWNGKQLEGTFRNILEIL